ncbi:hypothetical protein Hanom_Chr16g01473351 [Helianthus anomalus]
MAIKVKPQGPRFKKFEIWTKMAKVSKPQGPKWQFTLILITLVNSFRDIDIGYKLTSIIDCFFETNI